MCRAVWVIVAAGSEEQARLLRRALGTEAQVVLVVFDANDAALPATTADVVVVDAAMPDGARVAADAAARGGAVLWVGGDPPAGVHHATEPGDDLSGALTRTVLAKRSAG